MTLCTLCTWTTSPGTKSTKSRSPNASVVRTLLFWPLWNASNTSDGSSSVGNLELCCALVAPFKRSLQNASLLRPFSFFSSEEIESSSSINVYKAFVTSLCEGLFGVRYNILVLHVFLIVTFVRNFPLGLSFPPLGHFVGEICIDLLAT